MAYELPVRGEPDWDTKLNASIEAVKATADTASTTATTAADTADAASTAAAAATSAAGAASTAAAAASAAAAAAPDAVASDIEGGTGPVATALAAELTPFGKKAGGNTWEDPQVFTDGPWVDAAADGAVADCVTVTDGAITTGTAILTSASGWFTDAHIGKVIEVTGAGAAGGTLATTILSRQSGTQVTLAANASTTVSGARVDWGTDNTVAIQAAIDRARSVSAFGGAPATVNLAPGRYLVGGSSTSSAVISVGTAAASADPVRIRSIGSGGSQFGGVWKQPCTLVRRPSAGTTILLGTAGNGLTLDGITLDGGGGSAAALHVDSGFEFKGRAVRIVNVVGTAAVILGTMNARIDGLRIHDCGTSGDPVLYVGGGGRLDRTGSGAVSHTAFVMFNDLNIENCDLDAPLLSLADSATADEFAGAVFFNGLHLEAPGATAAAIRLGYSTGGITSGSIYCGSGGAIVHDDQQASHDEGQHFTLGAGLAIIGDIPGTKPTNLITLSNGDGFRIDGPVVANCSGAAISIASTYGDRVAWSGLRPISLGATGVTPSAVVSDSRTSQGTSTPMSFESVSAYRDVAVGRHILTTKTSGTPTAAAQAGAGTGASASVTGNDVTGVISLTTGTGAGTGDLVKITFGKAYGTAPNVILAPLSLSAAQSALGLFNSTTVNDFTLTAADPVASTAYFWSYVVIG